jgi:rRNA maturation protein Rpf1
MAENDSGEIASGALAAKTFMEEIERIANACRSNEGGDFDVNAVANLLESDQFTSNLRHRRGFALAMADVLGSIFDGGAVRPIKLWNPMR